MTDRRRITEAPGIGKKASDDLSSLGVTTLRDMISLRPRRKHGVDLDLTPVMDVIFILLIISMIQYKLRKSDEGV